MAAQSNTASESVVDEQSIDDLDAMVTVTVPRRMLRHLPVEPSKFAALRDELKLSNKQCAEAIDRTLSRVSELTKTKGASQLVFERWESDLRKFAAEHPNTEAAEAK